MVSFPSAALTCTFPKLRAVLLWPCSCLCFPCEEQFRPSALPTRPLDHVIKSYIFKWIPSTKRISNLWDNFGNAQWTWYAVREQHQEGVAVVINCSNSGVVRIAYRQFFKWARLESSSLSDWKEAPTSAVIPYFLSWTSPIALVIFILPWSGTCTRYSPSDSVTSAPAAIILRKNSLLFC